ncbi:hypothetical protein ALC56_12492 [Trachymyrmex septentrionalis]|uniref:Uncharacterized protein n=1 Tax=Trachymyrmex septentrionalis TaxID=34720 RepID=A0A195EZ55_9HYME|nr:hypothetical protein ALC56_12492 [Trachymyrmex septentrionalis]
MLPRCDGMYTKRGGDFGRKTDRMVRKGWPTRIRVYRGSEKRNGEIAGSPPGSKITYVFPLFAFSTCYSEPRCKTHLPGTTIEIFTRDAELILLYQVSRNETTASSISMCRKVQII